MQDDRRGRGYEKSKFGVTSFVNGPYPNILGRADPNPTDGFI